jgi:hypothetical protein
MEVTVPLIGQATALLGIACALIGFVLGILLQRCRPDPSISSECLYVGRLFAFCAGLIDYLMAWNDCQWVMGYAVFALVLDVFVLATFIGVGLSLSNSPNPQSN